MSPAQKKILLTLGAAILMVATILVFKGDALFTNGTETYVSPQMDINDPDHPDYNTIENGIHLRTGFVEGEGLQLVINNCTTCHSAKLVTQNRMSKEQWKATIRWMQETQNLWDLGAHEQPIVDYLATHYAPSDKGRRQNLENIKWYPLETD